MMDKKGFDEIFRLSFVFPIHPWYDRYFWAMNKLLMIFYNPPGAVFDRIFEKIYWIWYLVWKGIIYAWAMKYTRRYMLEMIPRDFRLQMAPHDDFQDLTPMTQKIYRYHFLISFCNSMKELNP